MARGPFLRARLQWESVDDAHHAAVELPARILSGDVKTTVVQNSYTFLWTTGFPAAHSSQLAHRRVNRCPRRKCSTGREFLIVRGSLCTQAQCSVRPLL